MSLLLVDEQGEVKEIEEADNVWEHHCGSQLFQLQEGGRIRCAECQELLERGTWSCGSLQ